MKLYTEYKKTVENILKEEKIKKAYFTTFNISPEFVERYIIPPLYKKRIPKNKLHYEDINEAIETSTIDLRFFYDANMLKFNESKRTIAKFYPILLKKGVFHPKVIYIEGEKTLYIFVGSGNLTLNGWGRNIESFRIIKFYKDDNLYNEVWNFFDDVFRIAKIKNSQPRKKPTSTQKINFVYSFDKKSNFIENLDLGANLKVWSPYFSDIDKLLKKNKFDSLEKVTIVPDVEEGKIIRIKTKPGDSRISFYQDEENTTNRFNHSKIWLSDTKIAIGSYNMSEQAIDGVNFEAAIIEEIDNKSDLFDNGEILDIENLEVDKEYHSEDDISDDRRYKGHYKLIANWKTRKLKIEDLMENKPNKNLEIELPSACKVQYNKIEKLTVNETTPIFLALPKNKIFTVKDKNGNIYFRGLIEEQESKGYRDKLKAENIEDIFYFFEEDEKDDKNLKERLEERILLKTFDNTDNQNKSLQTIYHQNYFTLFKGIENLDTKLKNIKNEKELHNFCFSSAASITTIIDILEKEKQSQEKNLFLYLFIEEINRIIYYSNKLIKKDYNSLIKIEKIKNIDLPLKKEDKEFLKACKNV